MQINSSMSREQGIRSNMLLARHIVKSLWRRGSLRNLGTIGDAVQEGYKALIRAWDKFDHKRPDAKWSSYASKTIRRHLLREHRQGGVIHTPASAMRQSSNPALRQAARRAKACITIGVLDEMPALADSTAFSRSEVREVVARLPPADREVIEQRFGLGPNEDYPWTGATAEERKLREMATEQGVTPQTIAYRERRALEMLADGLGRLER
jgi:RNA polymerase sigma factor (sigma-70 family)